MCIRDRGYTLIPEEISLDAYRWVFRNPGRIFRAYINTIGVTVAGTAVALLMVVMGGYVPVSYTHLSCANMILKWPLEALCHKPTVLDRSFRSFTISGLLRIFITCAISDSDTGSDWQG